MATTRNLKTLRYDAEELLGSAVTNRDQLIRAVPVLSELQRAISAAKENLKACVEIATALSNSCSKYANGHLDHVFGSSISYAPNGVVSGDLVIDEQTYHFFAGFDGYVRNETGKKFTQEFLASLPEGWTKQKCELDTTAINNAGPSNDELAEHGLAHKPKYTWGIVQ